MILHYFCFKKGNKLLKWSKFRAMQSIKVDINMPHWYIDIVWSLWIGWIVDGEYMFFFKKNNKSLLPQTVLYALQQIGNLTISIAYVCIRSCILDL